MSFGKSFFVAATAALALFAQPVAATHGGVTGGIKFTLSGTFECLIDPGEMNNLFQYEEGSPYLEFRTISGKTIACTRTVDGEITTGEFQGSFRTTGPLQIGCQQLTPAGAGSPGTSKQTITSTCSSSTGGDVAGTLTSVSGGFGTGVPYNIGGADTLAPGITCETVFPDEGAGGLPQNVILKAERFFNDAACGADQYVSGDVIVSVSNGTVQWRQFSGSPNPENPAGGNLRKNLSPTTEGCGVAGGFTTGTAFDSQNNLYVTMYSQNEVCRFDRTGAELSGKFAGPYNANPHSIVFDNTGNAYIGTQGGNQDIYKVDTNGVQTAFNVPVGEFGPDVVDIACDQQTILYTSGSSSEGPGAPNRVIRSFNIATGAQSQFATLSGPGETFGLRIIPSGEFAGQVLVADGVNVKRISADGQTVLATYDAMVGEVSENGWFSLDLDANGTHFWAASFATANVYRFELAVPAAIEGTPEGAPVQIFNTGTGPNTVFGLRVKDGLSCGQRPTPVAAYLDGPVQLRPCGAPNVFSAASCSRDRDNDLTTPETAVVNVSTALTPTPSIPLNVFPSKFEIEDMHAMEGGDDDRRELKLYKLLGVWAQIHHNDFVRLQQINRASLTLEGVPVQRLFGLPICLLKQHDGHADSLICRFSREKVKEALRTKWGVASVDRTAFIELQGKAGTGNTTFKANTLINLLADD